MQTDDLDGLEDDLSAEDPRAQLQDRIAELLAELSEATDAPDGVSTCAQFSAGDVDFESDGWMSRLADVQGWLRFDDDLPTSDQTAFMEGLARSLGFESGAQGIDTVADTHRLSETALERLSERAAIAAKLCQNFIADFEADGGSQASATASWVEAWSTEEDSGEDVTAEPVKARADTWNISDLVGTDLNLAPSYQRGDVWRTGDRQALMESILRGIPLPSIIMLNTGPSTPHEVVDGKQRLTAILRFVGKHPVALEKVAEAESQHPDKNFGKLFHEDYPRFRRTWKRFMGEPLTARLEDEYYFPFKLRNDAKGGLVGQQLEPLRGKYFTQIKENIVNVAGQEVQIKNLFERKPQYKVPVIEYLEASQRQIHEVFKLYNKQGMHLNAEEIRNAIYHDIELTRAILVAAGDASARSDITKVAPAIAHIVEIRQLGATLAEYGFGESRYRRTKVLGWLIAVLINDTGGKLLPSTSRHTDLLLQQVQDNAAHPLRSPQRLADLFQTIARAVDLHAGHDELWPDKFRGDGKSSKWQDLQLIGSLAGVVIAAIGAPDDIEERIEASADEIRVVAIEEWRRPNKTQTRTQWNYIARVALGVVEKLGVDVSTASEIIRERFGSSGVESLRGSIIREKTG